MVAAVKVLLIKISETLRIPVFTVYREYLKRTLSTSFNPSAISSDLLESYWGDSESHPQFLSICEPSHMARLEASLSAVLSRNREKVIKVSLCLFTRLRRDREVYKLYDTQLRERLCQDSDSSPEISAETVTLSFEVKRGESSKCKSSQNERALVVEKVHSSDVPLVYKFRYLATKGSKMISFGGCFLRDLRELFGEGGGGPIPAHVPRVKNVFQIGGSADSIREWVCGERGLVMAMHDGISIGTTRKRWREEELFENPDTQRFRILLAVKPQASPSLAGEGNVDTWKDVPVVCVVDKFLIALSEPFAWKVIDQRLPSWRKSGQWRSLESRRARTRLMTQKRKDLIDRLVADDDSFGRGKEEEEEEGENGPGAGRKRKWPWRKEGEGKGPKKLKCRDPVEEERWPCSCADCKEGVNDYWGNMPYFGGQKMYKTKLSSFDLLQYLNLDTPENINKLDLCLNSSIVAFDIESYTLKPEETNDGISLPGLTAEEIGGDSGMIGRQPLHSIGVAYGFQNLDATDFPYREFVVDSTSEDGARRTVADFCRFLFSLQQRLEKKKRQILAPLFDVCKRFEEAHMQFWSQRGCLESDILKWSSAQIFGRLRSRLEQICTRIFVFSHAGSRYDMPAIAAFLTLASKELHPKKKVHILKNGSSITRIALGRDIILSDSISLTPFTSLKNFGELTGLSCTKGLWPHAYFTHPDKLKETKFPTNPAFFTNVTDGTMVCKEEIEAAEKEYVNGGFANLGEYLSHYLKVSSSKCNRGEGRISLKGDQFFAERLFCLGNGLC